jgi:hypothetical protein
MGKKDQSASIVRFIVLLTRSGLSLVMEDPRAAFTSFVRNKGLSKEWESL